MRLSTAIAKARKLIADREEAAGVKTVEVLFCAPFMRYRIIPSDKPRLILVLHTDETIQTARRHRNDLPVRPGSAQ
jgi:hypothetical protein